MFIGQVPAGLRQGNTMIAGGVQKKGQDSQIADILNQKAAKQQSPLDKMREKVQRLKDKLIESHDPNMDKLLFGYLQRSAAYTNSQQAATNSQTQMDQYQTLNGAFGAAQEELGHCKSAIKLRWIHMVTLAARRILPYRQ